MRNVATGIPAGIWRIDNNESRPPSALERTGTPSTGKGVSAAAMPGRCAAPPAPAIRQRRPRSSAVVAYSYNNPGVRCALTTRASYARPASARTRAASRRVGQSEALPMMIPTCARVSGMPSQ